MFDTIFPLSLTVGGFSTTTKLLLVNTAWFPPRALFPGLPPPVGLRVARSAHRVTAPHAEHRTDADPPGYASVIRHPSHRTYAVPRAPPSSKSRVARSRAAPRAASADAVRVPLARGALVAARAFTLTASHIAHRTCVASAGNRMTTSHPAHRARASPSPSRAPSSSKSRRRASPVDSAALDARVTWSHSAHRTNGDPAG